MTEAFAPPAAGWTVDDLRRLPDIGVRYEIFDGSLLVSPAPIVRHADVVNLLHQTLFSQAPIGIRVAQNVGVTVRSRRTYFIPDICVVPAAAMKRHVDRLEEADVLLAVEVLSPSNPGNDLVLKRHYYATGRIPQYWVVDPTARTLTVLALDGDTYAERAVVTPGQTWRSGEPFRLTLDPADFL